MGNPVAIKAALLEKAEPFLAELREYQLALIESASRGSREAANRANQIQNRLIAMHLQALAGLLVAES